MRARLACIRQAAGYRSVSFLRHTGIEGVIANQCRNTGVAIRSPKPSPHGEGGSRVPRKRETDEGNLPLPMGEVPQRGGEGDFYPLSRLRRQLPQSGSQGGTRENEGKRGKTRENEGERIATPVCGLVRNDMCCTRAGGKNRIQPHPPDRHLPCGGRL